MMTRTILLCLWAAVLSPLYGEVFKPASVRASSFVSFPDPRVSHAPETATDGKLGDNRRYWANDFKNKAPGPHWIEFDFNRPVTFDRIKLDMVERYNFTALINNFKLEYFDGKKYLPIVEKKLYRSAFFDAMRSKDPARRYTAVVPSAHPVFEFSPVTGTRVRLTSSDSLVRLDEMTVAMGNIPVKAVEKIAAGHVADGGVYRISFAPESAKLSPGFKRGVFAGKNKVYYTDRIQPDGLRRYFAAGQGDNEWSIPVAKGYYRVFVMSGDFFARTPGCAVTVNGKKLHFASEPDNTFFWDVLTVAAQDKIEFKFSGNWLINALIVAPLAEEKAFEAAVQKAVIGEIYETCKADSQATHTAEPKLSAAERKEPFIFWQPTVDERIFPQTTPREKDRTATVRGQAGTDSIKALSLVFFGLKNLEDFSVNLKFDRPAITGTLHPVRVWVQRTGHKGGARTYADVPELLEKNAPKFLYENRSLQYYMLVDVPAGTPPGVYNGKLTVSAKGMTSRTIPVAFTVEPFRLDRMDARQYAAMYMQDEHRPFLQSDRTAAFDLAKLSDLRRHNMNSILFPTIHYENSEQFKKVYLHVNRMLDQAGFPRFPMAYHNMSLNATQVREIRDIMRETGLREILFYPVDEPHFGKRDVAVKLYAEAKKVPGIRTYSTVSQQDIDAIGDNLDVRCYMITGYAKFEPDRIRREAAAAKKTLWWYSNAAREYPAANRYRAGFFQNRVGASGQLYWAYDNACGDAFNDFDHRCNDHSAVYTIGNQLYSTIQWEAIREGLDDLRYIYTLERLIAEQTKKRPAEVAAARKLLQEIRDATEVDLDAYKRRFGQPIDIHRVCFWEDARFEQYRERLSAAIRSLSSR